MRALPLSLLLLAGCCPPEPATTTTPKPVEPSPSPSPKPVEPPPVVEADATPDVPSGDAAKRDAELAQKATAYVDAFTNTVALWTPDAKRLAFLSTRDGLPQLYVADATKPDSPATRVLTTTERIGGVAMTKDGKSLLFLQDTGANELWSVYRVNLDGSGLVELTPGEKLNRDMVQVPYGKPDTMFFTARKMSEPKTTLYSASTTVAGEPKAIYSDEQPAFLSSVAPDGKTALVTQYPSRVENYVLRVDIATGKAERIFPASGSVSISGADYSPDGKLIYVGTDNGTEQTTLLALDAKTGKQVAKLDITPATAGYSGLTIPHKGTQIALTLVIGSYSEIRILDGKTLKQKAVAKMPLGQGQAFDWSTDGKRLSAQWSTPSAPTTLYAIDATTGAMSPLRVEDRPTLKGLPEIESSVVEIPAFDGGKIPTNVYVAKGESQKPHPTIVVYHGGPSGVSMIRWSTITGFFVSLGYAVVEPNVRGSSGYGRAYEAGDNGPKRLDAFKDIETSARWVAAQPFADKTKLVVVGGSYGGYTTLVALSRWPDIWRAGVDLFGVANLKTFMDSTSGFIHKIFLVEFGDPDKDAEFLKSISPLTDVDKIVDPTFVYAGANDPRVPRSESDLIVKALRTRKVRTEYMVAENEGHSISRRENQIALYARVARFLEVALR